MRFCVANNWFWTLNAELLDYRPNSLNIGDRTVTYRCVLDRNVFQRFVSRLWVFLRFCWCLLCCVDRLKMYTDLCDVHTLHNRKRQVHHAINTNDDGNTTKRSMIDLVPERIHSMKQKIERTQTRTPSRRLRIGPYGVSLVVCVTNYQSKAPEPYLLEQRPANNEVEIRVGNQVGNRSD